MSGIHLCMHMLYSLEKIWQLQVELRATQEKVEELQQQNAAFWCAYAYYTWNECICSEFTDGGAVIVQEENHQSTTLATQASKKHSDYSWGMGKMYIF